MANPNQITTRILGSLLLIATPFATAGNLNAQLRDRSLPSANYYIGFAEFYAADYEDAFQHFTRGANTAYQEGPNRRFLDSACYWTMAGECQYHMGNYANALRYYEEALDLLLSHAKGDWQERVDPKPASIQRSTSAFQQARVNWYSTSRGDAIANIPNSFNMMFGRLDAARAFTEGGVVQPAEIRAVDHAEIMRCAALALHRRYSIKGVTCQIDRFTARLVSGLSSLPTDTPILGKWNQMLIGLAELSAGKANRAATKISGALRFDSGLDHNLTPIGLLALAQITFAAGEVDAAATMALEASSSAAVFNQFDLIEESLSLGTIIHLSQTSTVYPPLSPAIQWAATNRARQMQASLITRLADCQLESDDVESASRTLSQTRRAMSGTDLGKSTLAARIRYLTAAIEFMNGRDGYPELQRALSDFQQGSRWLFQLGIVDAALASGSISQRQAELVYEQLLIDPSDTEWKLFPMESMAYLTSPHVASMEAWFEILVGRKNHDQAIEVGERIRRHRFFSSLPMAGRMLALRWVLTAPEDQLTANAKNQRTAILNRYPQIGKSTQQIADLAAELRRLPLNPPQKSADQKKQQQLFVEQLNHAKYLESTFAGLALRRYPADLVFPPAADFSDISKGLRDKLVIISALQTSSGYHLYALTQQTRRYLGVVRARDLTKAVAELYKEMGMTDANNGVDAATLSATDWKQPAANLKQLIFQEYQDDQWDKYDELVVVPDGLLWYVPFEILQTGDSEDDWKNLLEHVRIRYLPVVALASHSNWQTPPDLRMAVVTGKVHPKATPELASRSLESLKDQITNVVQFDRPVKIPSNLLNTVVDSLVVWSDMPLTPREGVYALLPFQLDKGRVGCTLGGWMTSPWRGPEKVLLPMLSSGVASGLKSRSDGHELFLTSCGLLASGVRSALISRWRVGGENSLTLSREFAIRSRTMSPPEALHQSVAFAREQDLNLENEIRIKPSRKQDETLTAEHPFFWAGNMLVDLTGYQPTDEPADAKLAEKTDGEHRTEEIATSDEETNDTDSATGKEPDGQPETATEDLDDPFGESEPSSATDDDDHGDGGDKKSSEGGENGEGG